MHALLIGSMHKQQVFQRLQKLNLCLSHETTVKLVKMLGESFDSEVLEWRDALTSALESQQVCAKT